jgi:hypothetical protein
MFRLKNLLVMWSSVLLLMIVGAAVARAASPQIKVSCPTIWDGTCTANGSGFTEGQQVKFQAAAGSSVFSTSSLYASTAGWIGGQEVCSPNGPDGHGPCHHVGGTYDPGGTLSTTFSLTDSSLACDTTEAGTVQYTDNYSGNSASQPVTWDGPSCPTTTTLSIPSTISVTQAAAETDPASVTSGSTAVTSGTITLTVNGTTFCSYSAGSSSSCSLANLPVGTDQITASYSGSSSPEYAPSSASETVAVMFASSQGSGAKNNSNWAGYIDTSDTYSAVSGSWVVPKANCGTFPTGDAASSSAEWIGIDGFNGIGSNATNNNTVEQIGTDTNCALFTGTYWAWWQMYPGGPTFIGVPGGSYLVHPGDVMSASVVKTAAPGTFKLTITDETANWTFSTTQTDTAATGGSAEWIAEQPAAGGLPLTDFGSVTFTNCFATGSSGLATAIWDHPNTEQTMQSGATVKATPSSLSDSGSEFTVNWQHG